MKLTRFIVFVMALGAIMATIGELSLASAYDDDLMQPHRDAQITYITGGIGDEERDTLKSVKGQYNIHVLSAGKGGEFVSDVNLTVLNAHGNEILSTPIDPIFYASVAPGTYTLVAEKDGRELRRKITVGHTPVKVGFTW